MLAEIAAANAAFAVIKGALANGKELHQLGSRVFDYFDNKAKIQEKANKKGGGSDLEEFMALEQLNAQEVELRERMVYAGRPGMWADWQKFQAAAARRRREAKEAEIKAIKLRKAKMDQLIEYLVLGVASLILTGLLIYGIIIYMLYIKK
jgi:hypothetical protein